MLRKFSKDSREAAAAERERVENEARVYGLAVEASRTYEAWERAKLDTFESRLPGVQLRKGEEAYLVLDGVGLVEPRRAPAQWVGGSQGMSFRVAKGVHYRVGATRGHVVQGEERPETIDRGVGVVTNQRLIFVGTKRSTEWAYSKLLGYSLEGDSMAIFNVSNRQKASGFGYPADHDLLVDAVISAAIARFASAEEHAAVVAGYAEAAALANAEWKQANQAPMGAVHGALTEGSSTPFAPPSGSTLPPPTAK